MVSFIVKSETFKHHLDLVSKILASNSEIPILSFIKLQSSVKRSQIKLTASNSSQFISVVFDAEVKKDHAIAINPKVLSGVLPKLKGQHISVSINEDDSISFILNAEGANIELPCLSADDYPSFPVLDQSESFDIDVKTLRDGLNNTLFAASSEISKQILTGVNIKSVPEGNKTWVKFAATDSHRLATAVIPLDSEIPEFNLTIPAIALNEVLKLASEYTDKNIVSVKTSETMVSFSIGDRNLTSTILNGEYPRYEQLIPSEFEIIWQCDRRTLIDAIELIAVIDQKNGQVQMEFEPNSGEVILKSSSNGVGSAAQSIDADFSIPEKMVISFNIKYLLSGLKTIQSDGIAVSMNAPSTPVVIIPVDAELTTEYLVMPTLIRK
jgi:DNA polymerase-3 subunit beta